MRLIVQKYGGSSVGTLEKIGKVAQRIIDSKADDIHLVVVVSAMQGETDRLIGLANGISDRPDLRELDQLLATGEQASAALLAIALKNLGVSAISLTAQQMKLRTDGVFSRARIRSIDRKAIDEALNSGAIVVATGFQGIDDEGNLTTLGRGGGDTSGVALAAALKADECQICTDVLGVYTADPNICKTARKLNEISFEEMMEMASQGSKVLQIRSVELAMNHKIPLRVRSTFSNDEGTLVKEEDKHIEHLAVCGISHSKDEVKLTVRNVPDQPGVASRIFSPLAAAHINVDVIVQNISKEGKTDVSFTVSRADGAAAEDILRRVTEEIGGGVIDIDNKVGKVSIVGVGMRSHPGVAAQMFETLASAGINIEIITTSEIKVTCVIQREQMADAVRVLHEAFELDRAKPSQRLITPAEVETKVKSKGKTKAKAKAKKPAVVKTQSKQVKKKK
ncbi:MAG: aspartate kinase [Deltaproteobacteria bacterium]|nr:aspartate kinase [Deltaproteobacteria bacterium]